MEHRFYQIEKDLSQRRDSIDGAIGLYDSKGQLISIPYFDTVIREVKMVRNISTKNKLTDFLFPIRLAKIYNLVLSENVRVIFEKFNLPKHNWLPFNIKKGRGIHQYFLFQIQESAFKFINIENITLSRLSRNTRTWNSIDTDVNFLNNVLVKGSFPGYTKNKDDLFTRINDLSMDSKFHLDIFSLGNLTSSCIISNSLKEALENENITGVSYIPADFITIESE